MDKIPSGIKGLDDMLAGGLPKGRTILVSGHCGSGKTIFASQFINEGFKQGETGVYVTFEQSKENLFEDSLSIGIDFAKMEQKNKVKIIGSHIGKIKRFKIRTDAKASNLIDEIKEVIEELGASRVAIDSLNLFAMLFDSPSERRNAVAALVSMLEETKCTSILTCEVPEDTGRISWYGFEDFVVDGVLFLHRKQNEGTYQRAISIVKLRGVPHSKAVRATDITGEGIVVYDQEPDFLRNCRLLS